MTIYVEESLVYLPDSTIEMVEIWEIKDIYGKLLFSGSGPVFSEVIENYQGDLSRADLSNKNLCSVVLIQRDLSKTNFSGSNLEGANLTRCNAGFADFTNTNLRNANLTNIGFPNKHKGVILVDAILTDVMTKWNSGDFLYEILRRNSKDELNTSKYHLNKMKIASLMLAWRDEENIWDQILLLKDDALYEWLMESFYNHILYCNNCSKTCNDAFPQIFWNHTGSIPKLLKNWVLENKP